MREEMTDEQIRLECLRLVLTSTNADLRTVLEIAGRFADFVLTDRRPEPATGNGG